MRGTDSDMGQENTHPGNNGTGDDETSVEPVPASGTRSRMRSALDTMTRQRVILGAIILGALILVGVVIWVLVATLTSHPEAKATPAPATSTSRGTLPAEVEAKDYQLGDCFADFDSNATKSKVVDCNTDHSAQLGAIFRYSPDDSFPGTNALRDKGREICRNMMLNEASSKYPLLQQNVYPSSSSWDQGDRRVDCFIVVNSGNTVKESVLQK
ncbi:septum formation family protein [bacterium RCC_150]